MVLERILVLIRNVLQVPADPDAERRPDNDASVHDQVGSVVTLQHTIQQSLDKMFHHTELYLGIIFFNFPARSCGLFTSQAWWISSFT